MIKYSDTSTMKKNFAIRKNQEKHTCQMCRHKSDWPWDLHVHHIDGKKWDHSLKNLLVVCSKCHAKIHKQTKPWAYRKTAILKKRIKDYQTEIKRLSKILKTIEDNPLAEY